MIYLITFILSYCSIVYELSLAQGLSAFLGNSVLRYSVTIGLYLASMGIGAFLTKDKVLNKAFLSLFKIEICLSLCGGFCVVLLYSLDIFLRNFPLIFSGLSHLLIIFIGILTGFELPLLIDIRKRKKDNTQNMVLGINYLGAFLGTILFSIVLLPTIGLMAIAFSTGLLNALSGLALIFLNQEVRDRLGIVLIGLLVISLSLCLYFVSLIQDFFIKAYLS